MEKSFEPVRIYAIPIEPEESDMKATRTCLSRSATASLLAGLLCCLPAGNPHAQIIVLGGTGSDSLASASSIATSFRGGATAVSGVAVGSSLSIVNSGTLVVSGGAQEASSLGESVAGAFSAGTLHTATIGQANASSSEASAASISVNSGGFFFAGGVITADFVMSRATAACTANGPTVSAQVEVSALVIDGQSIAVSGQANQMVMVGGNIVIINEQFVAATATTADITVNALHVITSTGVNLVFGSATAGITCGSQAGPAPLPPACGDFVTGGGWIRGTPSGAKANFGVAGGIKNGAFWGHLNNIDHGSGMHVKATAVTGYAVDSTDPDCRIIDYNVTIDGQTGTARVRVCDKGEPGRNDIFQIQLSNGYAAGGDLGGSQPGGGNIQLHKCR
jgi:hypothetical protein